MLYYGRSLKQSKRPFCFDDVFLRNGKAAKGYAHCWVHTEEGYRSASNTKLFLPLITFYSLPVYLRDIITIQPSRSTRSSSLVTLLHPQAQSSLKITNRSFRYAAPHLWNKLPPSLRVPCQSATSEYSPPLPVSDSAPKSVVGVSHRVFHSRLKTHLFSRFCPP